MSSEGILTCAKSQFLAETERREELGLCPNHDFSPRQSLERILTSAQWRLLAKTELREDFDLEKIAVHSQD